MKTLTLTCLVNCPHCNALNEFPLKVSKEGAEKFPAFMICSNSECVKQFGLGIRLETQGMVLGEDTETNYGTYDCTKKKYIN